MKLPHAAPKTFTAWNMRLFMQYEVLSEVDNPKSKNTKKYELVVNIIIPVLRDKTRK